jgi:hypothetical protein
MPILTISPHHILLGQNIYGRDYESEVHPFMVAMLIDIVSSLWVIMVTIGVAVGR